MKNCTCGVKFTGGLHSNWCDTLAPDEPEPDTMPSPWHGYDLDAQFLSNFSARLIRALAKPSPLLNAPAPPVKPAPQATDLGDGTSALDKICVCGKYIVRDHCVHIDDAGDVHGTICCTP